MAATTAMAYGLYALLAGIAAAGTAYAGKELGEAIDKSISKSNSSSFNERVQKITEKALEKFEETKKKEAAEALEDRKNSIIEAKKEAAGNLANKQPQEEPENNNVDENKNKTPIIGGNLNQETSQENQPQISDQTSTNIESMLNGNSLQEYLTKMRDEQWAREDEIRKETQLREDTAIQRQVKDMWRAGVNPNLMNVTGAESGGGITNATGIDYSVYQGEVEKVIAEFTNAYNNAFKDTENAEDRLVDLAQSVINLIGLFSLAKGRATK